MTNSPKDITEMLTQSFEIVTAKKIKELISKVLKVYTSIIKAYQNALIKFYNKSANIPQSYQIA